MRESQKKYYENLIASGKCRQGCGNNCEPGKTRCSECLKKHSEQRGNKTRERKTLGKCSQCGGEVEAGKSWCKTCLEKVRTRERSYNENGKCKYGCGNDVVQGHTSCTICILKTTAKAHLGSRTLAKDLLDLFNKQNGICPFTKLPLTIGVNTELDHIIPKTRGGKNELKNFQWVHKKVNQMKKNMLEDEFLTMIELIYKTKNN